jgi:hypothetical protein
MGNVLVSAIVIKLQIEGNSAPSYQTNLQINLPNQRRNAFECIMVEFRIARVFTDFG